MHETVVLSTKVGKGETKIQPRVKCDSNPYDIDFTLIKQMCESEVLDPSYDVTPHIFKQNRAHTWPSVNVTGMGPDMSKIYSRVAQSGLPNFLGEKIPLPTNLNISVWERNLSNCANDIELLKMIKYGFPLGYMGPPSHVTGIPNHPSATNFPEHVGSFISKELQLGGIVGPMEEPPFKEWTHMSPLMTRPKKGSSSRRIIIDMTYPKTSSVNAYIAKNTSAGVQRNHVLPTIDDLVSSFPDMGSDIYLSTLDVSRAYKNFTSCPLDWPLLGFSWDGKHYCDITMPFGARSSSCHMQRVATSIVDMLGRGGVKCFMYLDDLIILSRDRNTADTDFLIARNLLSDLGLPEAADKAQSPSKRVRWLGIDIDCANMTLSLPLDKIAEVKQCIYRALRCKTLSKRHLQSLLGKLIHVGKCVRPARLFISRLLQSLRDMKRNFVKITSDMRLDLTWFREFMEAWNGVSLIPASHPSRTLYVDASGSGIGGSDGTRAYGGQITPQTDPVLNISELEAANVVVAAHTFFSESDRGSHFRIFFVTMKPVLKYSRRAEVEIALSWRALVLSGWFRPSSILE